MILLVSIDKHAGKDDYTFFILYKVKYLPFFIDLTYFLVVLSRGC